MQDLTVNNEVRIPSYPFKVVLLGDGGTGKTTFVKRFIQEPSPRKWVPNISVDINVLRFDTAHGKIALNVWDTAGQEKYGSLRDGYLMMADAAIILFDVTARLTYRSTPVVICGNKVDLKDQRRVKPKQITFHRKKNLPYFDISAKSNYNLEKPFLFVCRRLTNDPKLEFTAEPSLLPPETEIDRAAQDENEALLETARNQALPEEDDDDLF
ncbi:ran small gtpase family protein [Acanthamoeba castellanii str. Neff]|uniref:Ran small gtpase family protein n=1 Tax=Acanthamoeba castellanii (strain ATCC 30010 / Neff) TaxID=1257118 RepID=L8GIJ6_ACACF|nr:ran small gtpase family protein [Acanthamoeba castellanii str. Neff]ELR12910.1 ran small gtpase family protein [Acanthamoeba castellanii str. Neff]